MVTVENFSQSKSNRLSGRSNGARMTPRIPRAASTRLKREGDGPGGDGLQPCGGIGGETRESTPIDGVDVWNGVVPTVAHDSSR